MRQAAAVGREADVSVCGEMASDPLDFLFLLSIGIRRFSMVPWKIPIMKKFLSSISVGDLEKYPDILSDMGSSDEVEKFMKEEFKEELKSLSKITVYGAL